MKGREDEVLYLIYYSYDPVDGEVVIYVDNQLDIDWETDGKIGEEVDQEPLRAGFTKIICGIAELEPIAQNWPKDLKLTTKRRLGEPLACMFRKDPIGAEAALENTREFVMLKSRQVSRYWTLQGCFIVGGLSSLLGLTQVLFRAIVAPLLGPTAFQLLYCFWIGCVGALLFVLLRFGTQRTVDSTGERHLHYLEAMARIVGGGIAGILVGGMVKLGVVLPIFTQTGMQTLAMCGAAMIAGASERLAAGIVMKVESNEISKPGKANDDN